MSDQPLVRQATEALGRLEQAIAGIPKPVPQHQRALLRGLCERRRALLDFVQQSRRDGRGAGA